VKDYTLALVCSVFVIGFNLGRIVGSAFGKDKVIAHACGECDHVAECGDYVCSVGVDGWHLKDSK
jgi:hypothetical protein